MIQRKSDEHNGVKYNWVIGDKSCNGFITNKDKKWKIVGKPEINHISGSYKYNEEIQIRIFATPGTTEEMPRVEYAKDKWERLEIFIKPDDFWKLCLEFWKMYKELKKK